MILRLSALLVLATAAFFVQRAAVPILEQNAKVRDWSATDVTVTARSVETPVPRRAGGPAPRRGELPAMNFEVVYRHEVGGSVFRTRNPAPRSADWLPAGPSLITEREGTYTRRGHYDPARPDRLFFPKPFGFRDYWPVFFWGPLLGLGFGGLVLRKPGHLAAASSDSTAGKGWHRLRPKYSIRHRASGAWGVAIVCNLIAGAAAFDYFTGEPRARSPVSDALVCLAMAPGLVTLGLAIYYTWMARRVGEPKVWVDAPAAAPGTRLAARVELPVRRDVDLEHVVVTLACVKSEFTGPRAGFRTHVIWEGRTERDVGRRAPAGGHVTFEQRLLVPADAMPSFSGGLTGPWIDWEVRLEFHLDRGPDYRGKFPIRVEPG